MPSTKRERPRDLSSGEAAALARATAEASAPPRPTATPTAAGKRAATRVAGTVPTLAPPGRSQAATGTAAAAGSAGGSSAWTTIAALWSINQSDNVWFYDSNVGWKQISPDSDIGVETVNAIASHAKASGASVQYVTDDASGMVTEITCF
jgi:hypothetical protein